MSESQAGEETRLEVRNYLSTHFSEQIRRDVEDGMTAERKSLPSKYFYDRRGSELFDRICDLPEYYLTRAEVSILEEKGGDIMAPFREGDLVEMGSGANRKVRRLLDAAGRPRRERMRYVPVDVSETALIEALRGLVERYPELRCLGIVADFTRQVRLLPSDRPKLLVLFGSTIGNFDEDECLRFLRDVGDAIDGEDRFLIGLDMVKPRETLEAAYNDDQGVTEAFNKNILRVVNRSLGANFDSSAFEHVAFFNEERSRVEMHLRSERRQTVEIEELDLAVELDRGETIHTEISRKFSRENASRMFAEAGLTAERWFSDARGWFSLVELRRADGLAPPG